MNDYYQEDILKDMAGNSGILLAVESFLEGLPTTVRDTLSAGELADAILKMIANVRAKRSVQQ